MLALPAAMPAEEVSGACDGSAIFYVGGGHFLNATDEDNVIVRRTVSPACSMRASVATGYSLCGRGSAFVCADTGMATTTSRQATASALRSARNRHGAS